MEVLTVFSMLLWYTVQAQNRPININNEKKSSYVQFPRWKDTTEGEGTLEFKFKTNKPNGLLLYTDGGWFKKKNHMFMVTLINGALNVHFKMGSDDMLSNKNTDLGSHWNDMKWHHVRITRNFREINIRIGNHEKVLTSDGQVDRLSLDSNIIIGYHTDNINEGFTGCIKDLKYPIGSQFAKPPTQEVGDISDGCLDTCSSLDKNKCENGGNCLKYFDNEIVKCDCSNTGYRGEKCDVKEKIAHLQRSQVISKSMIALRSSRVNIIQFRFRTNSASGIILYSGGQTEYILVELHGGNLILQIALGTDPIVLTAGNGKLHDGEWHKALIERYGNKVALYVDKDRFVAESSFKYYPPSMCHSEHQKVYVGGHRYPQFIAKSLSKGNFEGCLQQVYFQDPSIEIIRKATVKLDMYTQIMGGSQLKQFCSVVRKVPKLITTATTTTATTTATTTSTEAAASIPTPRESKISSPNKNKLNETTVAWIIGGICAGSVALVTTLACGFHLLRKRYSGQFSASYKAASTGIPAEYIGHEPPQYYRAAKNIPKASMAL